MRSKKVLVVLGLAVVLGAAGSLLYFKRQGPAVLETATVTAAPQRAERQVGPPGLLEAPPVSELAMAQKTNTLPEAKPEPPALERGAEPRPRTQNPPLANQTPAPQTKPPVQDEVARLALSLVGADPDAEAYWLGAINDPGLSAHERQDLIEDLNEDGLSDPDHPSISDLPLIISRLQLIQELAPYAMDQVNADAFAEAGKDLLNIYNQLTQQP